MGSRSSSGRCAPSRHPAEGHPQVLIIARCSFRRGTSEQNVRKHTHLLLVRRGPDLGCSRVPLGRARSAARCLVRPDRAAWAFSASSRCSRTSTRVAIRKLPLRTTQRQARPSEGVPEPCLEQHRGVRDVPRWATLTRDQKGMGFQGADDSPASSPPQAFSRAIEPAALGPALTNRWRSTPHPGTGAGTARKRAPGPAPGGLGRRRRVPLDAGYGPAVQPRLAGRASCRTGTQRIA